MEINASCQKGVVVKDSVNININENINPELKINGPDIVCTYRNVNYSARSSGFDAPHVFNWKLNGDDAGQGESVDLYIHKNSVLTLTMKITNPDPDKCYKNTVDSTSMDIIRSNSSELDRSELTPKDTTVCKGNKVNFQLKSDIKGTVEWYLNRKKTQFTGKSYVSSSDQEGSNEVMAVLIPKYACDDSQRDTSIAYSQVEPLPDDSVYIKNNTLFSNDDHAQHHWLNCDDNYKKIKDETSQFYIPKNNNSYAVEVTLNGCVDTSECIQITGKIKNEEKRNIKIFPNPSDKKLNIYIPDNKQVKQISVIHPDGRIIKSIKNLPSGNFRLNTEELAPSVYFIKIKTTNNKIVVRKWLKR